VRWCSRLEYLSAAEAEALNGACTIETRIHPSAGRMMAPLVVLVSSFCSLAGTTDTSFFVAANAHLLSPERGTRLPQMSTMAIPPVMSVCFCHPSPPPFLFGPRSLVEREWARARLPHHDRHCIGTGGRNGATCGYRSGSLRVVVAYGSSNEAIAFRVYAPPNRRQRHLWAFLVTLQPPGAHTMRCYPSSHFNREGSARACFYRHPYSYHTAHVLRRGDTVVVAQYLHPRGGSASGVVKPI
jgi:hypothetical protein